MEMTAIMRKRIVVMIKSLLGGIYKVYLNGVIGWVILLLTLLSALGYEIFDVAIMVFFLLILILVPFAIGSFINIVLLIFTDDRGLKMKFIPLFSNFIFIVVVIFIYIFIINVISLR